MARIKLKKSFPRNIDLIEMTERNGVFIPIKSKIDSCQQFDARVPGAVRSRQQGHKELVRPLNSEVDLGKIVVGIVGDFFKIICKEMFR